MRHHHDLQLTISVYVGLATQTHNQQHEGEKKLPFIIVK